MEKSLSPLAQRIKTRAEELGLSIRQVGTKAGGVALVQNIMLGKSLSPRADNLARIADVLEVSTDWLRTGSDEGALSRNAPPNASFPPRYQAFPEVGSLPLLGQIASGPNGRFILNGQTVDRVFCPPMLAGVEGAYAVRIFGTSMEPRYQAGETVWINPTLPVRQGDDVVAQILGDDEDESGVESYIKQFVSMTAKGLRLKQLNPEDGESEFLEFPQAKVFSVHKVVFHATL